MDNKKTIHFVYATPYSRLEKIIFKIFNKKLWHISWEKIKWPKPIRAPLSITYFIAMHLSRNYNLKLYDLREHLTIEPNDGDILLGHIWPDRDSIVWRALDNKRFRNKYLIGPYNHDPKQILWMQDALGRVDKYFAICGKYWMDTFEHSPVSSFRHKFVHLNMAIETKNYPFLKKQFNPQGKRKFFYIGRYALEKGTDLLERMASNIPGFTGGYICLEGDIKGWKKICDPTNLTSDIMRKIAEEYDVFINMSRADAQATTVLEAMSWGFPIACTRESGYTEEDFFYLHLGNEEANLETINKIQKLTDEELITISIKNRKLVEANYGWDLFLSKIDESLNK